MISIDLPTPLEEHFWDVMKDDYNGDVQAAIQAFLELHERYAWKEQLREDVESIRSEVRREGGIKTQEIDDAIKKYRKNIDTASG
ncbi:hypothetical protein GWO43_15935 [candidate division KSB1 bacterium]|nr:hypothetical protein [candidate division KSB1 bacterium]NIR68604.1 hypothetical protein [candidate division KSB1 bacterium]NIS25441.1 hypothetical protein [candidate division KSB1 bacterium]NIT72333.1 hypothetical protein [candidate division KSB1 bacterium]NIU26117.1 hypothetical protein [candidate division KSB1 bacterium]